MSDSTYTIEDLRDIREQSKIHASRIDSIKSELRTLLGNSPSSGRPVEVVEEDLTFPPAYDLPYKPARESIPVPALPALPPLPSSRPVLISKVDHIQSRLAQLAAALSPSNRSTPMSYTSPRRDLTPPQRRPLPPKAAEAAPEPLDMELEDILKDVSEAKLSKFLNDLEQRVDAKLAELREAKKQVDLAVTQFKISQHVTESNSVKQILIRLDQLGNPKAVGFDESEVVMIRSQIEKVKIHNSDLVKSCLTTMTNDKLASVTGELNRIQTHLDETDEVGHKFIEDLKRGVDDKVTAGLKEIRKEVHFELEKCKSEYEMRETSFNTGGPVVDEKLIRENQELRSLVRKMKISLSKWRVDYLNEATKMVPRPASPSPAKIVARGEPTVSSSVNVGPGFNQLSQTLGRMWTALGPSSAELVDFLNRVQDALQTGGPDSLEQVYKDECSRHVEKLPLAELAARREYLLAKRELLPTDRDELNEITANLTSLIFEYQAKHHQPFVYDGEEYIRTLHRVNVRA